MPGRLELPLPSLTSIPEYSYGGNDTFLCHTSTKFCLFETELFFFFFVHSAGSEQGLRGIFIRLKAISHLRYHKSSLSVVRFPAPRNLR